MSSRGCKIQEFVGHASDIRCLNIGKKSHRIFITGGEDRKVNLWAIGKSNCLLSLAGHASSVESVSFDSTEVLVLAGSSNGTIKLWDLEEAKTVRTLAAHRSSCISVGFHPFGEFFASGSLDTDLKIWDIRKKGCIHTYKGHTQGIRTIKFTPDGRWVVTGGDDNVVKLWDLTAGKLLHDFNFHNDAISCIDFHPQEFLLATGSADKTVKFWDLETFELIGSSGPETTGVRSMIFHHDGRALFCGLDRTLKVLSWEPIRDHDIVDIGWSTLSDLSIYEGKLFGCSFLQSNVEVWAADISLIEPYAIGTVAKKSDVECIYDHADSSILKFLGNGSLSSKSSAAQPLDCDSKTKEMLKSPSSASNECSQNIARDISPVHLSNVDPVDSSGLTSKTPTSSHIVTTKTDPKLSSKLSSMGASISRSRKTSESAPDPLGKAESKFSARVSLMNSTILRRGKASESSPDPLRRAEPKPLSKNSSLSSSKSSDSRPSTLKEGPTKEAHPTNRPLTPKEGPTRAAYRNKRMHAVSGHISMPVVVPRDNADLEGFFTSAKETMSTRKIVASVGGASHKFIHDRSASHGGIIYDSQSNANVSQVLGGFFDKPHSSNVLPGRMANSGSAQNDKEEYAGTANLAENIERSVSLEQPLVCKDVDDDDPSSLTIGTPSVKYVRGVAVQLGKTRSLVESWEKRERCNSGCTATNSLPEELSEAAPFPLSQKGEVQACEKDREAADDYCLPGLLLDNHNVFINAVKSRLTKLQAVRHVWQQGGVRGAIKAVLKLPDHSVHVEVICVLMEKEEVFNLDLFSCLLPGLAGLLSSKTERHVTISLEMLVKLVKVFGSLIRSTRSAPLSVGVDIEAEKRLECCNRCFIQLENIKEILPSLVRQGGLLAKHAQGLNIALYDF